MCDHVAERLEVGIGMHVRVRGQHGLAWLAERVLELVAERGAGVVDLGLEGHAEQADRHGIERRNGA